LEGLYTRVSISYSAGKALLMAQNGEELHRKMSIAQEPLELSTWIYF